MKLFIGLAFVVAARSLLNLAWSLGVVGFPDVRSAQVASKSCTETNIAVL
ncbi:hypothetical protein CORC01_01851 [Colletotrichum orchidophilum]|uniref:Uncharacterized protein n=1 Tax=Colletotrichum orchidophilum TaxID=1209926 RepID=A0A1G4BMQ9_9PEZI|nr:uncharacterized protein CORC01_01851 [Colletotrichum orchidophilum]OHF02750.1 hypothetical protein CORC01_01851 [Colletotrichum orchidophilum]